MFSYIYFAIYERAKQNEEEAKMAFYLCPEHAKESYLQNSKAYPNGNEKKHKTWPKIYDKERMQEF